MQSSVSPAASLRSQQFWCCRSLQQPVFDCKYFGVVDCSSSAVIGRKSASITNRSLSLCNVALLTRAADHYSHLSGTARATNDALFTVIKDRKWMDITGVFNFAHTTNNASFVLRKYYISLLHRYEQVYFAAQDRLDQPSDDPESCVGDPVTGRIDGKLEHGYLVTVTVGSEKLRGILYHRETGCVDGQCPDVPCMSRNIIDDNAASGIRPHWKRRKGLKKRDPAHPKPNRSGYNFFFADQHIRLKSLHPDKDKEISKMIGDLWNKSTDEEKAVYQERGLKDKERYKREMQQYKERLNMQIQKQEITTAMNSALCQQLDNGADQGEHRLDHHSLALKSLVQLKEYMVKEHRDHRDYTSECKLIFLWKQMHIL
eukprot:Gb_41356 [translate_table: standard]